MTESTALSKKEATEVGALYSDLGIEDRAGEGQDGATTDDYAMPFLALLQSGSPQVKKTDPRKVEGAEEGMFFNTVEKEVYGDNVRIVPVAYRRSFVEWITREEGGGFVGEYAPGSEPATVIDDKNRDIIKENGHELKDTRYWYVFVVREDGTFEPAVMGMSRTQIKPSKALFNLCAKNIWPDGKMRNAAPPFYVWSYNAKSIPQQNDEYSFWNLEFTRGEPVTDKRLLSAAVELHDSVKAGQVREATDTLAETEASESGSTGSDSY
jgi:hypothetical protein